MFLFVEVKGVRVQENTNKKIAKTQPIRVLRQLENRRRASTPAVMSLLCGEEPPHLGYYFTQVKPLTRTSVMMPLNGRL